MSEQLKAFLAAVQSDASLQGKLKAAADTDAVVEIAREAGFPISPEELKKAQTEVSEQDLEEVSGGILPMPIQCFHSLMPLRQ